MKQVLVLLVLSLTASSAFANHQPVLDTKDLGCQEARHLIKINGWRRFTTNGGKAVDYYTDFPGAGAANCSDWQREETAWVATKDGAHCPIGLICVDKNN